MRKAFTMPGHCPSTGKSPGTPTSPLAYRAGAASGCMRTSSCFVKPIVESMLKNGIWLYSRKSAAISGRKLNYKMRKQSVCGPGPPPWQKGARVSHHLTFRATPCTLPNAEGRLCTVGTVHAPTESSRAATQPPPAQGTRALWA